jgi:PTS system ascorbate-specific IIB component
MMRIATICGMGLGTSMMLKLFIDDVLKEEGVKAETLPWDLGTFRSQQADIVVAASDMSMHLKNTSAIVVLIRNLVDKQEIRVKILAAVQQYYGNQAAR